MHTVEVPKDINLTQLSYELCQALSCPPPALRAVAGKSVTLLSDGLPPDVFVDVVNAHVADPDWTPPKRLPLSPKLWPPRPLWRRLLRRP